MRLGVGVEKGTNIVISISFWGMKRITPPQLARHSP
jgi:hypothetical protein